MEKVSIIIPVYNCERTIERTLISLFNQTYNHMEIIVINDGSTDNTENILNLCIKQCSINENIEMVIIKKENGGVSSARNMGIERATGRYLMFVDSDDYCHNRMVEYCVKSLIKYNCEMEILGYTRISNNKNVVIAHSKNEIVRGKSSLRDMYEVLFQEGVFNSPYSKVYRTDILKVNNIKFNEELSLGEDFIFNLNYYFCVDSLLLSKRSFYNYDCGSSYLTKKYREHIYEERVRNIKIISDIHKQNGLEQKIFNWLYIKLAYSCFFNMFHKDNRKSKNEKLEYIDEILNKKEIQDAILNFVPIGIYQKILYSLIKIKSNITIYYIMFVMAKFKDIAPLSIRKMSV